MRRFALALILPAALAAGPGTASAAEAGANIRRSPGSSANFTLAAANGYSLYFKEEKGVLSIVATRTQPAEPTIDASGGIGVVRTRYANESVYTTLDSAPKAAQINADLGPVGSVSLVFHPSGKKRVTKVDLEAKGEDCIGATRIVRRLGTFEGSVVFHAENGYTSAAATSVPGTVGTSPIRNCTTAKGSAAGTEAETTDTEASLSVYGAASFAASRTARGVTFHALSSEQLAPNVGVARLAVASAERSSFWFAGDGSRAGVKPPAPFSGTAAYTSRAGSPSWTGDLSVDFPGLTQPLTGEGLLSPQLRIYPAGRD
ncbi:MAG TPA: hypothetical protein VFJ61_13650 [Solirubrobacterales bacterium]|nr:hypothetical protein [Solirubrobacterales bacterium]